MVGQGWTLGNASDQGPHAAPETLTTSTESAAATMNTTDVKEAETTGSISGQTADATNDRPSTSTKYLRYNLKWYNKSLLNKSVNGSYHIWFLETSSRRKLKARQACSVESACRHNSDFTVHLLSNGNISSPDCPYHDALSKIPNFRSAVLNASAILVDTPLAPLQAEGGPLTRSRYATEHLSDFLRLAMLWIHGGIYIDLDVIVMKSLEGIRNTVFYESEEYNNLASTVLFFDKHHPALGALMDESARMYRPGTWRTVLEAVETLLSDAVFSRIVNIASSSAFLPVYYPGWKSLFGPKDAPEVLKTINGSYGVHFWNSISKGERVVPGSGCALDLLARAHCPWVYRLALSDVDL
ncbi:lactosylceramide 4-alpha-galactosyltransferase-like isoform X2 [Dermacentor andersoni]|uniref:lactosylceramide 4-alpha-galactosyltransferase-like isoform X2 n=1 Tax=Dermacentor andersoni TaxID=34620 RepID=UPI003B3A0D62